MTAPGPVAVEKPWHAEAKRLRAGGLGVLAIALAIGKSPPAVRWCLDEHGERETTRQRARRSRAGINRTYSAGVAAPTSGAREAYDRPHEFIVHHAERKIRRILPPAAIKNRALKAFASHEIDFATLSAILHGDPAGP